MSEQSEREALLPCPFCGGEARFDQVPDDQDYAGGYFIACTKCKSSTNLRFACGEDPKTLLREAWNRRAALATPAPVADAGKLPELLDGLCDAIVWNEGMSLKEVQRFDALRADLAQALKGRGAAQWVSVKDRLPEHGDSTGHRRYKVEIPVWVWDGEVVLSGWFAHVYDWPSEKPGFDCEDVTHWMPRPTPAPPEAQP